MSTPAKTKTVAKKTTRTKVDKSDTVSSKMVSIKKAPAKKVVALGKTVSPKNTSVKKTVLKKSVPKSSVTAVVKSKKSKPKNLFTEELVTMPSVPSLRLLEKTEIYKLWYQKHMARYVTHIARCGGYLFIVLGTVLASSSYLIDKDVFSMSAAVVCSENCVEVPDESLPLGSPLVTFPAIPAELVDDLEIALTVQNTNDPIVSLVSSNSGEMVVLEQLSNPTDGQYHYMIPAAKLAGSSYTILAEVKTDSTTYKFTGQTFTVPSLEEAEMASTTSAINDETATDVSSSTTNVDENTNVDEEVVEDLDRTPSMAISLKKSKDANYLNIKTGNFLPTKVEVYSKLEFSDEPIFLGLATLVQGEWVFSLSALDLPVANHLVYASFVGGGVTYQTDGVLYVPTIREVTPIVDEAELAILLQKVNLSLENASHTPVTRTEFYSHLNQDSELFDSVQEKEFVSNSALRAMEEIMTEETENLNSLLQHFASAVQVGNPYLINLADSTLTNHYKSIAHNVAVELDDNSVVPSLTTILALRYQILKDLVIKSEQSFKTESSNLIARDSDKDGLSDFDEMTLYKTNPSVIDTDSDGVSDAVEIIKDFNPNVSDIKSAATITQSLDEVVFAEVVDIDSVDPVVVKGIQSESEELFALIQGKSLPNVFVTIISYTSGTLGIIRTNDTGNFAYTLEKNLFEGNHEIVAVLTDNEGNIVASSKPYHFTNKENEFSVMGAGIKKTNQMSFGDDGQALAQNVTAAMGVVAFGFILLFLAQAVLQRKTIDGSEGEIIVA